MPESGQPHPGALASLRPQVEVPREARGMFVIATPAVIATWALGGFYMSFGPSLVTQLLRSQNGLWGGVVIFLLFGVGSIVVFLVRASNPQPVMIRGCLLMLAGAIITYLAIATRIPAGFLLGTAVAGAGSGLAFLGALRMVTSQVDPNERAGIIAAIYIVSYLAMALPALLAGVATSRFGLEQTAQVYSVAVAVLTAVAAGSMLVRRPGTAETPERSEAQIDLPPGPCTVPPSLSSPTALPRVDGPDAMKRK